MILLKYKLIYYLSIFLKFMIKLTYYFVFIHLSSLIWRFFKLLVYGTAISLYRPELLNNKSLSWGEVIIIWSNIIIFRIFINLALFYKKKKISNDKQILMIIKLLLKLLSIFVLIWLIGLPFLFLKFLFFYIKNYYEIKTEYALTSFFLSEINKIKIYKIVITRYNIKLYYF